ncbi:MAG: hypothetical protein AAFN59_06495, partial [Pseudomonadota bacterium]
MKETSLNIGRILSRSGLHGKAPAPAPENEPKRRPFHRKKQKTSNVVTRNAPTRPRSETLSEGRGIQWNAPGFAPMTRVLTSFGA